jgi:hypothetical protein
MSQLTHPGVSPTHELRTHWILALSALLALAATVAVVLVLAIDGGPSDTQAALDQPQAAQRSDGGPDESTVAWSVGSRISPAPSETIIPAGASARPLGVPASHGPAGPAPNSGPARPIGGSVP